MTQTPNDISVWSFKCIAKVVFDPCHIKWTGTLLKRAIFALKSWKTHNLQYSVEGSTFDGLAYFKHQIGSIEPEQ